MSVAVITGSAGLVGAEATEYFCAKGMEVVGIDNDMRRRFFGDEASTLWQRRRLEQRLTPRYCHHDVDIRDNQQIDRIFQRYGRQIELVIHTAAQPSHDWAANSPPTDFSVNAGGTLNLLEATRRFAPDAVFIFTSTNKVYGDRPNSLPLVERETRWEIEADHPFADGITEEM
jgi:CDP-paratose 2-epimerase